MTACVSPSMLFHIAYYCLMRVTIGRDVNWLSAYSAIIPDLVFPYCLVVAFARCYLFYLLDIGHFKLQESQRILNEVGEWYSSQVLKALLQQIMSVFVKPTGHCGVALLVPYPRWWFVVTFYHIVCPIDYSWIALPLTTQFTIAVYHRQKSVDCHPILTLILTLFFAYFRSSLFCYNRA